HDLAESGERFVELNGERVVVHLLQAAELLGLRWIGLHFLEPDDPFIESRAVLAVRAVRREVPCPDERISIDGLTVGEGVALLQPNRPGDVVVAFYRFRDRELGS